MSMDNHRELLLAKLKDCVRLSRHRPCFLGFLDENEAAFCESYLKGKPAPFLLWGGYQGAERVMAGFFPDYLEPSAGEFPLAALTFLYRPEDAPGHRDFLGAFMKLGVERDVVGDILVGERRCVTFLREEMVSYFQEHLRKVGQVGVKISQGFEEPLPAIRKYKDIKGVIASNRLDCLTALLCRTSREKAAGMIAAGLVAVNHRETTAAKSRVEDNDIISVRGCGKFRIDSFGPLTSKGRLTVNCRKYQ